MLVLRRGTMGRLFLRFITAPRRSAPGQYRIYSTARESLQTTPFVLRR